MSSILWNQVEVILIVGVSVLYNSSVNQASRRRILKSSALILNKESLSDALVHNDNSDERLLGSFVVGLSDSILELGYLSLENLTSHSITDSVSVDDEVTRKLALLLLESIECTLDGALEVLVVNYLLAFLLYHLLRVVLTHLTVDGGTEANDGLGTRVTDIDSNQHSVRGYFLRHR